MDEIINNMERMNEDIATLRLMQDKNRLVLYGDPDIHLSGMMSRVETLEDAVRTLVETDKSRQNIIKGIVIGSALQGGGIIAILAKVFS